MKLNILIVDYIKYYKKQEIQIQMPDKDILDYFYFCPFDSQNIFLYASMQYYQH